jgi:hypothetical protein
MAFCVYNGRGWLCVASKGNYKSHTFIMRLRRRAWCISHTWPTSLSWRQPPFSGRSSAHSAYTAQYNFRHATRLWNLMPQIGGSRGAACFRNILMTKRPPRFIQCVSARLIIKSVGWQKDGTKGAERISHTTHSWCCSSRRDDETNFPARTQRAKIVSNATHIRRAVNIYGDAFWNLAAATENKLVRRIPWLVFLYTPGSDLCAAGQGKLFD